MGSHVSIPESRRSAILKKLSSVENDILQLKQRKDEVYMDEYALLSHNSKLQFLVKQHELYLAELDEVQRQILEQDYRDANAPRTQGAHIANIWVNGKKVDAEQ